MIPQQGHPDPEDPSEGVRISDRRKIDPETFEVRQQESPAAAPEQVVGDEHTETPGVQGDVAAAVAEAQARAAEAEHDLKRIAAEYANYRRRVDRDREVHRDNAIGTVIAELLPVLDDIERARSHGDLDGAFKSVAEAVEAVTSKFGLEVFGGPGEAFDPTVHEAMTSQSRDDVAEPTVETVYQVGYRLRGRVLRPARVGVVDGH